jgi:uncharacterized membrane protein YqaE (UPF0057 family)
MTGTDEPLETPKCDVSTVLLVILAIILPPAAVLIKDGLGIQLLINIILTLIGYLPGIVHALWIVLFRRGVALAPGD